MGTRCWTSGSEAETERAGELLAQALLPQGVLLLEGEMGSGKTVLVRGLARTLGVDPREVQSPTYTLVHEHEGSEGRLVHVDLYRLEGAEVETLGLEELLAGEGLVAIEWAERLAGAFPGTISAQLRRLASGGREIRLQGAVDALPERPLGDP